MSQDLFGTAGKPRLERLVGGLRGLHRTLIDVAKRDYEAAHGPVAGPVALFRLAAADPSFAWLQPMTRAIVDLEETLERPVGNAELEAAVERVRGLLDLEAFRARPAVVRFRALLSGV
jgi:hypothetical protein